MYSLFSPVDFDCGFELRLFSVSVIFEVCMLVRLWLKFPPPSTLQNNVRRRVMLQFIAGLKVSLLKFVGRTDNNVSLLSLPSFHGVPFL